MEPVLDPITKIPESVIAKIPDSIAIKFRVIPLEMRAGTLVIGLEDPQDLGTVDTIRFGIAHMSVQPQRLSKEEVDRGLARYYGQSFEKSMEQSISLAEEYL